MKNVEKFPKGCRKVRPPALQILLDVDCFVDKDNVFS